MDETKNKRTGDTNRRAFPSKKKNVEEKKTKSDTSNFSSASSSTDQSVENIFIVGKSCVSVKSKSLECGYRLHECHSETAICPLPGSQHLQDVVPGEGVQATASNISFISAKSDLTDVCQKKINELQDKLNSQNETIHNLKQQLEKKNTIEFASVSTEIDSSLCDVDDELKDLEKKVCVKEKRIKDLYHKLNEYLKANESQVEENKGLNHQVNLLQRQLQSMYELVGQKSWSHSVGLADFAKCKNKVAELEAFIGKQKEEKESLVKKLSESLDQKEKELDAKNRELLEYKNRSTLEVCKLLNQIDFLREDAKAQSLLIEAKISAAQNSMDHEILNTTQKLEEQYQKDIKSAIDKFHSDFERLANLPKTAIEKLLKFCDSDKVDLLSFQKDWDSQQKALEGKIESLQVNHDKEILHLKDCYESKILFLKTQVESLTAQLQERKNILDIFESELAMYKSNSSINLLRSFALEDDVTSLKELYTAEIHSQKQVHQLQVNIFEEKVKTLTEEILYHAKNEEIRLHELENAKNVAVAFREKYEKLVSEWEEKVEKDFQVSLKSDVSTAEINSMCEDFKNLIETLKKSGETHEEKIKMLELDLDDKNCSFKRDIEDFKSRLSQLEVFQHAQSKLDLTIEDLIKTLGKNYIKTVEALQTSHETELGLKQIEMSGLIKRHVEEMESVRVSHEEQVEDLLKKIKHLEDSKSILERKLESKIAESKEVSVEVLKWQGIIAVKEEAEQALIDRITELEESMKRKDENCRRELEELMAKFLEAKIMSAAKDDLTKELEEKLDESDELLEKSCREVDRLHEIFIQLEGKNAEVFYPNDGGDFKTGAPVYEKLSSARMSAERLRINLLESFDALERSRKKEMGKKLEEDLMSAVEKNKMLEKEQHEALEENNKLKLENHKLEKEVAKKKKILDEIKTSERPKLLNEKEDTLEAEMRSVVEKEEKIGIIKGNEFLGEDIRDLNQRIGELVTDWENSVPEADEVFSISLQEVRVLYEEEQSEMEEVPSTSVFGCQVEMSEKISSELKKCCHDLWKANEELKRENEYLRSELKDKDSEPMTPFQEEIIFKCKNVQNKLSEVLKDRDSLAVLCKSLEKERDYLTEELENLQEENYMIRASCDAKVKLLEERSGYSCEDSTIAEDRIKEMNSEIGKLSEYIKTLSSKLDVMRTSNEILLSESHEHLRHNQNLVSELEEAWNQRYEIEDQLAKVRKENALLNLHRNQLEETNKRISNLVSEGKPSVVSWIKIHETVENIVDEVLALKTSFSDSGSVSGASTGRDVSKTPSDLKLMTETLHIQLKNKNVLCDELLTQKENLERELKGLENLLKENDSRILAQKKLSGVKKRHLDQTQSRHSVNYPLQKRPALELGDLQYSPESCTKASDNSHLVTLNRLKKHLEDQVEMEEAHFRENLELEIKGLKKEMLEECGNEEKLPSAEEGDQNLASVERRYEEEVKELTEEFQREVERLRQAYGQQGMEEKDVTEAREKYAGEIDSLKSYFERKWADLEQRYRDIYSARKQKIHSTEQNPVLEQVQQILQGEESEKNKKVETLVKEIVNRHQKEVRLLRKKNEEVVRMLEAKHGSEVQQLQAVVLQLKENIEAALRKEEDKERKEEILEEVEAKHKALLEKVRAEYERKLEEEKKKLNDLLEESKQNHEKEIVAMEEFWTEKLSECETKCAIMRATGSRKTKTEGESEESFEKKTDKKMDGQAEQDCSEEKQEKSVVKQGRDNRESESDHYSHVSAIKKDEENYCVSCLSDQSYLGRMEVKTDDDKLEMVRELETYKEMVSSLRYIVTKLLSFIGQHRGDLSHTSFKDPDYDDTLYKSIQFDLDRSFAGTDLSVSSNNVLLALDLSSIVQEINENSLLNSSDQVRFELDRCLKQLKNEAAGLLALSCPPDRGGPNLGELLKRLEAEKKTLEEKVCKVEEIQEEMKKEISSTKDRLSQWERNLEIVSEGYGEEIIEPIKTTTVSHLKDKIKMFMADHLTQPSPEINLLEEICKESDRLQEEWKKERFDLQQQIDVADKQVHSLKKFLEEQAAEREQERETFDREINSLKESLKCKERDNSLQNRTNREVGDLIVMPCAQDSVEVLENQVKELTAQLNEAEKNKAMVEGEFQNAVKKIWSLREVIQDLEVQLAEVSERELNLKKKVEKLETVVEEESRMNRELREEVEAIREQNEVKFADHFKDLEEELMSLRRVAEQVNPETLNHLKSSLRQVEAVLIKKTKDLEQLHVSSANVSCSSPSEDVSIRDHLDATRCSTPDEMSLNAQPVSLPLPLEEIDRVHERLARHTRAEEVAMKFIQDLKMQLRNNRKVFEEVQTERDVLLERVDSYLKENSSLKVRLEEQRCNAGLLQKQLNASLESQISRLETDVEKLNELCNEKDKQLRDMKVILENTTKTLKMRESEALNKSREENTLITALKTDLANALNENEKLEEKLIKVREKLRETAAMPALIDSMLEEKNAEIDRLEKEVSRLSSEMTYKSSDSESRNKRKIKFSEPDSFGDCISSISPHHPSELRNCSDSYSDFKNSSFKIRRPYQCSTKLESLSSIGPLQLSPRGTDSSFLWKSSPPIENVSKSPPRSPPDFQKMLEESKLQEEIESKQRQISELQLESDILKRQLVEANQELDAAKSQSKEFQNELESKEEEMRKLKNNEKSLLITMESLKKNHSEEVDELQNKLGFEHGKVEKVYEEIKALEVKKIEIEEAFLSLREDYNEKISGEKKTVEALMERIKILEGKNDQSEEKLAVVEEEMKAAIGDSEETIQKLTQEILNLKNEKNSGCDKIDAGIQVEKEEVCICQKGLRLEVPKDVSFSKNLDELKREFDEMTGAMSQGDIKKGDAFAHALNVKRLFSSVMKDIEELSKELESHRKKVMECSVDDLAVKVQKELVLSAKLDNQLLSSIETNGFVSKDSSQTLKELGGGGDNAFILPKLSGDTETILKLKGLYKEVGKRVADLENERDVLEEKVSEQQKIIKLLEESLSKEKERILEERERCCEDAKIMELLRVNLEKGLKDIKSKDRDLKKERQLRLALEKEVEMYKKKGVIDKESKRIAELNAQVESQKEKVVSLSQQLEEEKRRNQELRLSLEETRIERLSEKSALRLMESDLTMVREQKENLKVELLNARKILNSRNVEMGLLKRKLDLQEIDLKALSLSKDFHQSPSETSILINRTGSLTDLALGEGISTSLLSKIGKLNSCVQRHVRESNEMGEALLYLSQETEQMRDLIRKLEEGNEAKLTEDTLAPDLDVERKLWALEKGRLVMDVEELRSEYECLKRDLVETCKSNELLKLENAKLKKESRRMVMEETPRQFDNGFLQDRVSHLTRKYMRAESYRKALAWQKHYLLISLKEYQRSEEEAWRKMGKGVEKNKEVRRRGHKRGGRFRVVALAVIAVFRMRYIVRRWQKNSLNYVSSLMESQKQKLAPLASVLNIYNEPVNPLSYQTQHIFRRPSSKVLRTPPSRDPGLENRSPNPELGKFNYLQESIGTAKALP